MSTSNLNALRQAVTSSGATFADCVRLFAELHPDRNDGTQFTGLDTLHAHTLYDVIHACQDVIAAENDTELLDGLRELLTGADWAGDNRPVKVELHTEQYDNGSWFSNTGTVVLQDGTEVEDVDLSAVSDAITELSGVHQPLDSNDGASIDLVAGTVEV